MHFRMGVGIALAVIGLLGWWVATNLIQGPSFYWKDPLTAGDLQLTVSVVSLSALALGIAVALSALLARRAAKADI